MSPPVQALAGGLELHSALPPLGGQPIIDTALPTRLFVPLLDYWLNSPVPVVQPGDAVLAGQVLATGVLAPTSGIIRAIEPRPAAHPSQWQVPHIVLEPDGSDQLAPDFKHLSAAPNIDWLDRCAICGHGGAGFPLAHKLRSHSGTHLPLLIINAVECEPGIASDEALMRDDPDSVLAGVAMLIDLLQVERCVIALEDDMPAALGALQSAWNRQVEPMAPDKLRRMVETSVTASAAPSHDSTAAMRRIGFSVIESRYPAGAEGPLIQQLSARHPAPGQQPADIGVLCINVSTAHAVHVACRGRLPCQRLVTINGSGASCPGVYRVRHGTSVQDLLLATGNALDQQARPGTTNGQVRYGGPLSGFVLTSTATAVGPATHCLWLEKNDNSTSAKPQPCIRCGRCAEVCPVALLPQQLYWHARQPDLDQSLRFGLDSCITCGCCDLVCPAHIPLSAQFRSARSALHTERRERGQAESAAARYQAHEARQQNRAAQHQADIERHRQAVLEHAENDPIQAALVRARQRKRRPAQPDNRPDHDTT